MDGSIHNLKPGECIVGDLDRAEYIKSNDRKRMYQTDELDAYIILAYDDNLKDNTRVLKLKTGEMIQYYQLIGILQAMDLGIKEFKKMVKDGEL